MIPQDYFLVAAGLYLAGAACAAWGLFHEKVRTGPWQGLLVALGVLVHTAGVGAHCAGSLTHYFTGAAEAVWLLTWSLAVAYLVVLAGWKMRPLGVFLLPFCAALLFVSRLLTQTGPVPRGADYRSAWYVVHVLSTYLSFGLFLTACVASILYLEQQRLLKRKVFGVLFRGLPSLEQMERAATVCSWGGLFLISVGLATGLHMAAHVWQGAWYLNPKVLATIVTWLAFLVLVSARASRRLAGRSGAQLILAGAVLAAVTFLLAHPFLIARNSVEPAPGAASAEGPRP